MVSAGTTAVVAHARVSLAGRVAPIGSPAPYRFTLTLTTVMPDRRPPGPHGGTYTAFMRPDGFYWFENVPPGSYRLTGRDEKDRHIVRDLVLPPGEDGKRPRVVELDLQFTDRRPAEHPSAEPGAPPAAQPSAESAAPSVRPASPPARRARAKAGR